MTRRYARAPRGERAHDSAPRNQGRRTSPIRALGLERGLLAMMTVQGAVDLLCFNAYVERVRSPQLLRGDVLVLDDLGGAMRVVWNKLLKRAERGCCGCHHIRPTTRPSRTAGQRSSLHCVPPKPGCACYTTEDEAQRLIGGVGEIARR